MSNAKRYNPDIQQLSGKVRGIGLYLLPIPLALATLIALWKGSPGGVIANLSGFALFSLAAIMARRGLRLENEYRQRKIARAPGTPWKFIAAVTLGVATGMTAWLGTSYGLIISILFGLGAFAGFFLLYGFDPRQDKTGKISLGVTGEEVIEMLEKAEKKVAALEETGKQITDPAYSASVQRIVADVRKIINGIEEDPSDLPRTRKFFNTYLNGILRVTDRYVRVQHAEPDEELIKGFTTLLHDFEQTVQAHQAELLENDRFDLDVQIKVLDTQLNKESIS